MQTLPLPLPLQGQDTLDIEGSSLRPKLPKSDPEEVDEFLAVFKGDIKSLKGFSTFLQTNLRRAEATFRTVEERKKAGERIDIKEVEYVSVICICIRINS